MPRKPNQHICPENKNYTIETAMSRVREIWLVYDVEEEDVDEIKNIIYDIANCPFCGRNLNEQK